MTSIDVVIDENLQKRIKRDGECWIWTGRFSGSNPLHTLRINGQRISVSPKRFYCDMAGIKSNRVSRLCNNSNCINPAHLQSGYGLGNPKAERIARVLFDFVQRKNAKQSNERGIAKDVAKAYGITTTTLYNYWAMYKKDRQKWEDMWKQLSL